MSEIKKNKGMIEYWIDGKTKPYILDVNKGQLLGLRGGVIHNIPYPVRSLAGGHSSTVNRLIYNGYTPEHNASLYVVADKLDSIGYTATLWELSKYHSHIVSLDFRKLANHLRNNPHSNIEEYILLSGKADWLSSVGLKVDGQLTEEMVELIYTNWREESVETVKALAYCLSRGLYEFFADDRYSLRSKISNMLHWLKELEWSLEKSDFFRQYINARRAYIAKQDEIANRRMAEYQEHRRNALTFETDNYLVLIPTTIEELRNEGKAQGNCVGGYGGIIGDKKRNVVFIRRKNNPNKPYITCDITPKGTINQYLIHHNNYTPDKQDLEFQALFQAHLYANWGE